MTEIRVSRQRTKDKSYRYFANVGEQGHSSIHPFQDYGDLVDYIATCPSDTQLSNRGVPYLKYRKLRKALGSRVFRTIDDKCTDGIPCGEGEQGLIFSDEDYDPITYAGQYLADHVTEMYRALADNPVVRQVITDFKLLDESEWKMTIYNGLFDGLEEYVRETKDNKTPEVE